MIDNSIASLPRQTGLIEATQIIANNIANASTPGYKSEGTIFAEYVAGAGGKNPSLSMGHLVGHSTDFTNGSIRQTGGTFDLAIEGAGFFKIALPNGTALTRAGAFQLGPEGTLVTAEGFPVVDQGGGPLEFPTDAVSISISRDGTISVDGEIFGAIGVFEPVGEMTRLGNNQWLPVGGDRPVETPNILQGAIEQSNVSPVEEFATLIAVQRLFEAGQTLAEQEHDRLSSLIDAIRSQR